MKSLAQSRCSITLIFFASDLPCSSLAFLFFLSTHATHPTRVRWGVSSPLLQERGDIPLWALCPLRKDAWPSLSFRKGRCCGLQSGLETSDDSLAWEVWKVLWAPTRNSWLFLGRNVISCEMSKQAGSVSGRGFDFTRSGMDKRGFLCAALSRNAGLGEMCSVGLRDAGAAKFRSSPFLQKPLSAKPQCLILVSGTYTAFRNVVTAETEISLHS